MPIADWGFRIVENSANIEIENQHSALYKFLHDRVQQAAYALIPDEKKKALHLKIGQLLLAKSNEAEREEKFSILSTNSILAASFWLIRKIGVSWRRSIWRRQEGQIFDRLSSGFGLS
jgi:hypothetical protein